MGISNRSTIFLTDILGCRSATFDCGRDPATLHYGLVFCDYGDEMLGDCATHEMAMMECLEAYGLDRGLNKCRLHIDDFFECQSKKKQFLRFMALRRERNRQIACGQLKGDKEYVTPKLDSF